MYSLETLSVMVLHEKFHKALHLCQAERVYKGGERDYRANSFSAKLITGFVSERRLLAAVLCL